MWLREGTVGSHCWLLYICTYVYYVTALEVHTHRICNALYIMIFPTPTPTAHLPPCLPTLLSSSPLVPSSSCYFSSSTSSPSLTLYLGHHCRVQQSAVSDKAVCGSSACLSDKRITSTNPFGGGTYVCTYVCDVYRQTALNPVLQHLIAVEGGK